MMERPPSSAAAASTASRKRVGVPDVDAEGDPSDLVGHGLGRLPVDVEHGHLGALLGHAPAGRPADARSATGHHGPLAVKQSHRPLLSSLRRGPTTTGS